MYFKKNISYLFKEIGLKFFHRPHLEISHFSLIESRDILILICMCEYVLCEIGVRKMHTFLKKTYFPIIS